MFREAEAYTARCDDLTLVVAADFDEWRIFLQGPDVIIHGGRQFTGDKAKAQALRIAGSYLQEAKGDLAIVPEQVEWAPLHERSWLNWRP